MERFGGSHTNGTYDTAKASMSVGARERERERGGREREREREREWEIRLPHAPVETGLAQGHVSLLVPSQ